MIKTPVEKLEIGDVLAQTVRLKNGAVALETGTVLTRYYIERLKKIGITHVYIRIPGEADDFMPKRKRVWRESVATETKPSLKQEMELVRKQLAGLLESSRVQGRASIPQLDERFRLTYSMVLYELANKPFVIKHLTELFKKDEQLLQHSLNVCILAGIIGLAKGYQHDRLVELGAGALLYDIGMIHVPDYLLRKKAELTADERRILQDHTLQGYNILKEQPFISKDVAECALYHHERYDGKGYPTGISLRDTNEYVQIVAICDVYDALISTRHHRVKYTPSEAAEYLYAVGDQQFSLDLIQFFLKNVAIYPLSSHVRLNTGQVGIVTYVNPQLVQRPIVKIVEEADGTPVLWPYEIDLEKRIDLVIVSEA